MALGQECPDERIKVEKVTPLPDLCVLTFTYQTDQMPESVLMDGVIIQSTEDFYVGEEPEIKRIIVLQENGSLVVVEWLVKSESVVYRAESKILYVCAPNHIL